MKVRIIRAAFAMSALLLLGVVAVFAQPKGDTVKVKGEVVDLWCYLEGGDHGAEHKACAISCAKAGNPVLQHSLSQQLPGWAVKYGRDLFFQL